MFWTKPLCSFFDVPAYFIVATRMEAEGLYVVMENLQLQLPQGPRTKKSLVSTLNFASQEELYKIGNSLIQSQLSHVADIIMTMAYLSDVTNVYENCMIMVTNESIFTKLTSSC